MVLDRIVATRRAEVAARRARRPFADLLEGVERSDRDFRAALRGDAPAFILELKPCSPSAGPLRAEPELEPAIAAYARHASAVSVLTDRTYFGGSLDLLRRVRGRVPQPVLGKDVIVDPYQVVEARRYGADAVLLMLSVLDDALYRLCADQATQLGMGVLTEVHTPSEMRRAAALGAEVIGINNRDLGTLAVRLETTRELAPLAPRAATLIAESGVQGRAEVERLRPLVDGFLVGTALMRAPDVDRATRELVFGRTKICGLTRGADAEAAVSAGATHGGLMFAVESPRGVTVSAADAVRAAAPGLDWVGVFVNEFPATVADRAAALDLAAVQLHGEESPEYIHALRPLLSSRCAIWKAARVVDRIPPWTPALGVDLLLLDAFHAGRRGGTGQRFDWALLQGLDQPERYGLSGGLDPDNVRDAAGLGPPLLDVSSGVEAAPGDKDAARIRRFMAGRRGSRREVRT
jgi:indole-3-glycerol phosphate synthase/phosphoribosylanthranilate isomerase